MLEAHGLTCRRGDQLLFQDLDLAVRGSALLQVVGPNGCGKTTLLRVLSGLRRPDEGRVTWNAADVGVLSGDFRIELAYVGHQAGIKEELTPVENLEMAAALSSGSRARVLPALKTLGLARVALQPCASLSSGQRRRVALARLLISPARLWILDEPLTGLDAQGQKLTAELLVQHADRGGLVVFTSHQEFNLQYTHLTSLQLA